MPAAAPTKRSHKGSPPMGVPFRARTLSLVLFMLVIFICFIRVLYDLQIVQGANYLAQSRRKIANIETVEAARGQILDRYGRVLVGNRAVYNVRLNTSLMRENRNDIILSLLEICREQGQAWSDTLPVSAEVPFSLTLEQASSGARNNFEKMAAKIGWPIKEDASTLVAAMRETYQVAPSLTDAEARGLIGVLYELSLRSKEITTLAYQFTGDVGIDFITAVKEQKLAGVTIETVSTRTYNTPYAAHLLGRVGLLNSEEWEEFGPLGYAYDATVGKDGVERAFEQYLRGKSGRRSIEFNTNGKVVSSEWVPDSKTGALQVPEPGGDVMLTLDIELQEAVETALANGIETLKSDKAGGGAAVVLDVSDGGVLAMASYPTYDLSSFSSDFAALQADPLKPLFNRALQGLYSPGSTFKMVTAIGGLEEEIITPVSEILDTGRYTYYQDYQPQCWLYRQYGRTHGKETVQTAIRDSCNVFFYDVGRRLGISEIERYARMFGLGESTGIELYEQVGRVASPSLTESLGQAWNEGSTLPAAIGQENNQFTILQLANYIATLANGGTHYSAHLLREVRAGGSAGTAYFREGEALDTINIGPENLEAVTRGMLAVTQEGGSAYSSFRDLNVQVAAKTGSSQVSGQSEANAIFVCFAPYENPEIALALVVEQGGSGSYLAGIAAEILTYYFSSEAPDTVTIENTLIP